MLLGLGKWLKINGEGIYKTRPFFYANDITEKGIEVRYTCTDDALYVHILGRPEREKIIIKNAHMCRLGDVSMLGDKAFLDFKKSGGDLLLEVPPNLKKSHAYVDKITPKPKKP